MGSSMRLSAVAIGVAVALFGSSAFAAETVTVTLSERADMPMMMNMGIGMDGDPAMGMLALTADVATVKAGEVTFNVTNLSTTMEHEMVVIPLADADTPPAYNAEEMAIDEDAAGAIGEVSELAPGATGTVTLKLEPGIYLLVCNLPDHYASGMWTILIVEP